MIEKIVSAFIMRLKKSSNLTYMKRGKTNEKKEV